MEDSDSNVEARQPQLEKLIQVARELVQAEADLAALLHAELLIAEAQATPPLPSEGEEMDRDSE